MTNELTYTMQITDALYEGEVVLYSPDGSVTHIWHDGPGVSYHTEAVDSTTFGWMPMDRFVDKLVEWVRWDLAYSQAY